jgi:hypothetical protein
MPFLSRSKTEHHFGSEGSRANRHTIVPAGTPFRPEIKGDRGHDIFWNNPFLARAERDRGFEESHFKYTETDGWGVLLQR